MRRRAFERSLTTVKIKGGKRIRMFQSVHVIMLARDFACKYGLFPTKSPLLVNWLTTSSIRRISEFLDSSATY